MSSVLISKTHEFHRFFQIRHREIEKFNEKIKQIIIAIVVSNFSFSRFAFSSRNTIKSVFSKSIEFPVEWNTNISVFRRAVQKFREYITVYKASTIFRNFLNSHITSSVFSNFNSPNDSPATKIFWISRHRDVLLQSIVKTVERRRVFTFSFSSIISQSQRSRNLFLFESIRFNDTNSNFAKISDSNFADIRIISIIEKIFRDNMNQNTQIDNSAQSFASDFNEAQRREIAKIVVTVLDHRRRDRNVDENSIYDSSNSNNNSQFFADHNNNADEWKMKNVDFFDFDYDDDIAVNVNKSIKYFDKHIYYVDVYVFVDRLKNLISLRNENKFRIVLSQCFRDYVQKWHSLTLFELKKNLLRIVSLVIWYQILIKSFKKRATQTLQNLQKKRYIMSDVKQQRNSRMYAQNIFRHVKIAELESVFNQFILVWFNFDYEFRRDISKSKSNITIRTFLDHLKKKFDIWFDMTSKLISNSKFNNSNRFNKQNRRDRQNGFSQSSNESNAFFFQVYRFVDYFVFVQQKQIYQKQSFV